MEGGRLQARGGCVMADDAEGPPIWKSSVRLETQLEDSPRFPGDVVYAPGDGSPRWARHPTGGAIHAAHGPVPPMQIDGAAEPEPPSSESAEREKWYKRKWREEWAHSRALQQRVESLQAELVEAEGQVRALREKTHAQSAAHAREVRDRSRHEIALKEAEAEARRVGTERDHWQERGERAEQEKQAALKEARGLKLALVDAPGYADGLAAAGMRRHLAAAVARKKEYKAHYAQQAGLATSYLLQLRALQREMGLQREHHVAACGSSGSSVHVGNVDTVVFKPLKLHWHLTWQIWSINGEGKP